MQGSREGPGRSFHATLAVSLKPQCPPSLCHAWVTGFGVGPLSLGWWLVGLVSPYDLSAWDYTVYPSICVHCALGQGGVWWPLKTTWETWFILYDDSWGERALDSGSSVVICFLIWFSILGVLPHSCLLFPSWHCAGVALSSNCQCVFVDWQIELTILSPGSLCLILFLLSELYLVLSFHRF